MEKCFSVKNLWRKKVLDEKSFGRKKFCTKKVLDEKSFGRKKFWTKKVLDEKSFGRKKFWTKKVLDEKSFERKKFWTKKVLDEKSFGQKKTRSKFLRQSYFLQNYLNQLIVKSDRPEKSLLSLHKVSEFRNFADKIFLEPNFYTKLIFDLEVLNETLSINQKKN